MDGETNAHLGDFEPRRSVAVGESNSETSFSMEIA